MCQVELARLSLNSDFYGTRPRSTEQDVHPKNQTHPHGPGHQVACPDMGLVAEVTLVWLLQFDHLGLITLVWLSNCSSLVAWYPDPWNETWTCTTRPGPRPVELDPGPRDRILFSAGCLMQQDWHNQRDRSARAGLVAPVGLHKYGISCLLRQSG